MKGTTCHSLSAYLQPSGILTINSTYSLQYSGSDRSKILTGHFSGEPPLQYDVATVLLLILLLYRLGAGRRARRQLRSDRGE
jgi:hypothetical protein